MDEGEDSAVQDFLQILEEHRKNCEKQGKYVEAEIAKNRYVVLFLGRAVAEHRGGGHSGVAGSGGEGAWGG